MSKTLSLTPDLETKSVEADLRKLCAPGQQNHLLLAAIINASDDAILSKTLDGIITSWNPAAMRIFGYSAQEVVGKPKTILFPPERLVEEEIILHRLRRGIPTEHFETVRIRKDGKPIDVSVTISPIKDSSGQVIGASTIARDITEYRRLQTQLQERLVQIEAQNAALEALAMVDGLTGAKNHRAFQERLSEEFHRACRANIPLSLLMIDVDKFKQYNDRYGHPEGDKILRLLAQTFQSVARGSDVVARYGGEEFAILLPETNAEEVRNIAERFRHAVEATQWPERQVTVSIGASTLTPSMTGPSILLGEADAALYRSKHRGRNCVTHARDTLEIATADAEMACWYDTLFKRLQEVQSDILGLHPKNYTK